MRSHRKIFVLLGFGRLPTSRKNTRSASAVRVFFVHVATHALLASIFARYYLSLNIADEKQMIAHAQEFRLLTDVEMIPKVLLI